MAFVPPTFRYIEGKNNVLVDCFSRLPRMEKPSEGKSNPANKGTLIDCENFETLLVPHAEDNLDEELGACRFKCCCSKMTQSDAFFSSVVDGPEMCESFLNHPPSNQMQNPLEAQRIQHHQIGDQELENQRQQMPQRFPIKVVQGRPLICYRAHPNDPVGAWKIVLPTGLIDDLIQ
jgi:hypothetical protein